MTVRGSSVWRVLAAWYDRPGPAAEVLEVGEMADPEVGPGEVRVRVAVSGINPGDTKKRGDWVGSGMPYPRVIPHSDGAGVVDAVGDGVDAARTGERVWVYGAQSYRAFGTAAQRTVVPAEQAVALPDGGGDPPRGARRRAAHRRGVVVGQRRPRRRGRGARGSDCRLRDPGPAPGDRLLAHAVREPHHPAAGQRRL